MKLSLNKSLLYLTGVLLIVFLLVAYFLTYRIERSVGADATSVPASVATTSNPTVGTTAVTVFATSTCAARTITTSANPIMITFSDRIGQTPTGSFGHLQGASTTVTYDAGQFGCGLLKIYGFTGNQVITVTESR